MIEHLFYHLDLKFFLVNPNESKSCENIQYVFWNKHGVSSQCVTAPFRLQNWVWFPHSMFNTVENCYVPSMLIMFLFRIQSFVYQNIFFKGQSKAKWFFQANVSFKKRTNKFYFTSMNPLVDLFLFVFWKKLKAPKRHFEIIWPLVAKQCKCIQHSYSKRFVFN